MLELKNVSVSYGSLNILKDLSFTLGGGRWLMVVGPNGAGKSTLVNAIAQNAPYTGKILYNGDDLRTMRPRERAHKIGLLSQNRFVGYGFSVREVVNMGRYSYSGGFFKKGAEQGGAVDEAIAQTGLGPLAEKSVLTLSGGELQRTFLAQLIAQDPELMLLDEPTNHLDLIYQKQIFSLIGQWIARTGRSVVSVVHDLSLAKKYGTDALLLGESVSFGAAEAVLTREALAAAYSLDVYGWMRGLLGQWEEK